MGRSKDSKMAHVCRASDGVHAAADAPFSANSSSASADAHRADQAPLAVYARAAVMSE